MVLQAQQQLVPTLSAFVALRCVELMILKPGNAHDHEKPSSAHALLPVLLQKKTLVQLKICNEDFVSCPQGAMSYSSPSSCSESYCMSGLEGFKSCETSLEFLHLSGLSVSHKTLAILIESSPSLRSLSLPFSRLLKQEGKLLAEAHSLTLDIVKSLSSMTQLSLLDVSYTRIRWQETQEQELGVITDIFQSSTAAEKRILAIGNIHVANCKSTETVTVEVRDMFEAIRDGKSEEVKEMLPLFLAEHTQSPQLMLRALLLAVENTSTTGLQVVKMLVEGVQAGFPFGLQGSRTIDGMATSTKGLAYSKVKLKTKLDGKFSLIHAACAAKNVEALQMILEMAGSKAIVTAKANCNIGSKSAPYIEMVPLQVAVEAKSEDCVRMLKKFGCSLNNSTALHAAVCLRLTDVVKLLLDEGSNAANAIKEACTVTKSGAGHTTLDRGLIQMLLRHHQSPQDWRTADGSGDGGQSSSTSAGGSGGAKRGSTARGWLGARQKQALNDALARLANDDANLELAKEMVSFGADVSAGDGVCLAVASANKQLGMFSYVYKQLEAKQQTQTTARSGLTVRATRTAKHLPLLYIVLKSVCATVGMPDEPRPMVTAQLKLIGELLGAGAGQPSAAVCSSFGEPLAFYLEQAAAHMIIDKPIRPYDYPQPTPLAAQVPMHRTGLVIAVLQTLLKSPAAPSSNASKPPDSEGTATLLHSLVGLFLRSALSTTATYERNPTTQAGVKCRFLCIGAMRLVLGCQSDQELVAVDDVDEEGETPLTLLLTSEYLHKSELGLAKDSQTYTLAKMLLDAGADPDHRPSDADDADEYPIHTVLRGGKKDCGALCTLLVEAGCNVNARDDNDESPLHAAVTWSRQSGIDGPQLDTVSDLPHCFTCYHKLHFVLTYQSSKLRSIDERVH
jgi:hypothetical protein